MYGSTENLNPGQKDNAPKFLLGNPMFINSYIAVLIFVLIPAQMNMSKADQND